MSIHENMLNDWMRWLGVKFNDNDYKNILALVDEMAPDFVHIGASIQNKDSDAFKPSGLKKLKHSVIMSCKTQ